MTPKKKLPPGLSAREYRGRTQYRARLVDRSQKKLDGRNVQVNSRWFDKQGDAKAWLEDKQRSLITIGSLKTDKTITVAKACEKFMQVSKTVGVNGRAPIEDATWQRYGSTYRTMIVGTIELIKIADLRPGMIHEWVQQLAASRGSDAAHRALGLLKMVLDYQVVVAEAIPANPAKSVNIAKCGANDDDDPVSGVVTDFMSPGDIRRLLTAADDLAAGTAPIANRRGLGEFQRGQRTKAWARWRPLTYLLITTGIRIGEACALPWKNVDLVRGSIEITCARKRNGTVGKPKSAAGLRTIVLGPQMTEMLAEFKADRNPGPNDCIFGSGQRPLNPSRYAKNAWTPMMQTAGLVDGKSNLWSRHDCRHWHASVLIRSGEDAEKVAERLGHADATVTQKVYSHLFKELQGHGNRAGANLETLILGHTSTAIDSTTREMTCRHNLKGEMT